MHCVTSSILMSVLNRQGWIKLEDRIRLVEWQTRLELAWYAACGSPALDEKLITNYSNPASDKINWDRAFVASRQEHDDGHIAKLMRAPTNGQD